MPEGTGATANYKLANCCCSGGRDPQGPTGPHRVLQEKQKSKSPHFKIQAQIFAKYLSDQGKHGCQFAICGLFRRCPDSLSDKLILHQLASQPGHPIMASSCFCGSMPHYTLTTRPLPASPSICFLNEYPRLYAACLCPSVTFLSSPPQPSLPPHNT